jgi:hypothetical protein
MLLVAERKNLKVYCESLSAFCDYLELVKLRANVRHKGMCVLLHR